MPFDFKQLLNNPPKQLVDDVHKQMWADMGQRIYANIMDERFVMAVVTAFLASANPPEGVPPNQFAARKIRAYLFSGTIAQ